VPLVPDGHTIRQDQAVLAGRASTAIFIPVTNAIERRFREVRRRTRPMGTFQDKTSMDRILFAVFTHENKSQGVSTPFLLTQNN
jgi:transposase-like protein